MKYSKGSGWHLIGIILTIACAVSGVLFTVFETLQAHAQEQPRIINSPTLVSKIAFASDRSDNYDIYVMNTDGGGLTRLTTGAGNNVSPSWSPDGTRIAFVSGRDGNPEIYAMNADGGNQTRLTNSSFDDVSPAFSPDGTKIAFVSNRSGHDQIFVMNADGSNQTNISNSPTDDFGPAWRPDGAKLAFSSVRDGNAEIYSMDANGNNQTRLTTNVDDDVNPTWSLGKITFDSFRDNNEQIYVMNENGTQQVRLTNNNAFDSDPARSADGAQIVFASTRDSNYEIYIANADGSAQTRLTNDPSSDIEPSLLTTSTTPTTIQFSASNYNVGEGDGQVNITVTRAGDTTGAATVDYATSDGTAQQRTDYTISSGTVTFAAGETSKVFSILINDDNYVEGSETFNLTLSNPTDGVSLGSQSTATVTIVDNDTTNPPTSNVIDDAQNFVRQHYLDFLAREPDAGGRAYWIDRITQCGSDAACIRSRRIGVSDAFFFEMEWQDTGAFLYRVYKASFGAVPDYNQYMPDRSRIIGGARLSMTKDDFLNLFVQRLPFTTRYPLSLTPEQYVDMLNTNTRNSLTQSQRDDLVNGLKAMPPTETRASVLRKVTDNQMFADREYNSAFVLSLYFNYLRRNPEPGGFDFWKTKIDAFSPKSVPGQQALVCSFITSMEYQQRFSSVLTHSNQECPQ